MSKSGKLALLAVTVWPMIQAFVAAGLMMNFIMGFKPGQKINMNMGFPDELIGVLVIHGITLIWVLSLLAYYLYNLFHNDRVRKDMQVLWVLVMIFGGVIGMIVYFFLYIWPEDKRPDPPPEEEYDEQRW